MELRNFYYYFKQALSPEICQRIIDLGLGKIESAKKAGENVEAWTFGDQHKGARPDAKPKGELSLQEIKNIDDTYVRDSKVSWLNETWLYDLILPYVREANTKAGWNWEWTTTDMFQFTVYEPGGFYSWHADGGSDHFSRNKRYIYGVTNKELVNGRIPDGYTTADNLVGKVRKISLTINLNQPGDYDGGNLKFDFGNHSEEKYHECEEIRPQGSIIVFPSFLKHCVTPVTRGTRYSLVLWCLGKPFK